MATHSSILPGKSHGCRSLVGYSPWGHKEKDMNEHTCIQGTSHRTMEDALGMECLEFQFTQNPTSCLLPSSLGWVFSSLAPGTPGLTQPPLCCHQQRIDADFFWWPNRISGRKPPFCCHPLCLWRAGRGEGRWGQTQTPRCVWRGKAAAFPILGWQTTSDVFQPSPPPLPYQVPSVSKWKRKHLGVYPHLGWSAICWDGGC